ncbi:MAG: YqgE/AlgH family protein [Betaproteobacteria bacterium]|nr:YqgE/AlgH family protein [Betaproteobacteria bacterium]
MRALLRTALLALLLGGASALAQQHEPANGVLLIAKPALEDPNFGRSVVLVTQTGDGHTLGVILNRPTPSRHEGQPLWLGGPVMTRSVVALFAADEPPQAAAFHVLKNVYLSMHPENLAALLGGRGGRYRLYSGFAAWAPGQLEAEFGRDAWHVLPADEALLFREDTSGLWEELLAKAAGPKT